MRDITQPPPPSGGLSDLVAGAVITAIAIFLSVAFEPTVWAFVLFTIGIVIALVGVGKLAHVRAKRRESEERRRT